MWICLQWAVMLFIFSLMGPPPSTSALFAKRYSMPCLEPSPKIKADAIHFLLCVNLNPHMNWWEQEHCTHTIKVLYTDKTPSTGIPSLAHNVLLGFWRTQHLFWGKVDVIWVNITGGAVKAWNNLWQKAKEDISLLPPSRKRIRVQTQRLTPLCLL